MKKLCLFVCLICCCGINNGYAIGNNCTNISNSSCNSSDEYLNISGIGGCYECDNKACMANTVILAKEASIGNGQKNMQWRQYECKTPGLWSKEVGNDHWIESDPKYCDSDGEKIAKNSDSYAINIQPRSGNHNKITNSSNDIIGVIDGDKCLEVKPLTKCKTTSGGYVVVGREAGIECEKSFGDNKKVAGELAENGALRSLDHVIQNDQERCVAKCKSDGWDIKLKDNGCDENYQPSSDGKECVMTSEYAQQVAEEKERQQQADAEAKEAKETQDKCEKSGGSWNKDAKQCECATQKHLVPKEPGKTCNCVNGYRLQNKVCILTDAEKMKRACKEINKPYLELGNTCDCSGDGYMFEFVLGKGCVLNSAYAACISDAAVASGARWKDGAKKCGCGEKEPDYYWNIEQELCVKSEKLVNQDNANQITAKVSELGANITKGLDGWQKTLSVWKTEEGKFNTARLASDSIAGVVLGTAGGLITSKVVKKNQVKSGFEDIECTVGGQKVADWHDEFTVGVQ